MGEGTTIGVANLVLEGESSQFQDEILKALQKFIDVAERLGQVSERAGTRIDSAMGEAVVGIDALADAAEDAGAELGEALGEATEGLDLFSAAGVEVGSEVGAAMQEVAKQADYTGEVIQTSLFETLDQFSDLPLFTGQAEEIAQLGEEMSEAAKEAARLQEETEAAARRVEQLGEKWDRIEKLGKGFSEIGKRLAIGITLPLTAMAGASVKAAIDFESSFAGIRKTMDMTEDEFQQLAQANRDLAKEIPVSVNELNRIGELAGQLGIRGVDNVLKFEDTIAKLAVTTDMTAEAGALAFAQIANVTRLPQGDIDRLGAAIVGLGNNFAATESRMVEFTQRIAGAGTLAGLTVGDIAGIGAAFASIGIEAEAGGTAVQKVLLAMVTSSQMGGEKLENFGRTAGVTGAEFKRMFEEDASAAFERFVVGLGQQGDAAINTLTELGLTDQRLTRAFLGMAGASDKLSAAIAMGNDEFEKNTALQNEAEKRFETVAAQLEILRNNVNDVGISLGFALLPSLNAVLQAVKPMIDRAGEMAKRFHELPSGVKHTAVAIGAVTAGIPLAMIAFGQLTGSATAIATAFGTTVPQAFTKLLPFLGPAGWIAAGLAAAALIWWKWGDEIKLITQAVWNVTQTYLVPIGEFIAGVFNAAASKVTEFRDKALPPIIEWVQGVREWLVDRLGGFLGGVGEAFSKFLSFIHADKLAEKVAGFVAKVRDEFQILREEALDKTTESAEKTEQAISNVPQLDFEASLVGADAAKAKAEAIQDALQNLTTGLRSAEAMNELMGESFDLATEQAGVYEAAVRALVDAGAGLDETIGPQGETLRELADRYLDLSARVKTAADVQKSYDARIAAAKSAVASLVTQEEKQLEVLEALTFALVEGAITQTEYEAATAAITRELSGASEAMKEFEGYIESAKTEEQKLADVQERLNRLVEAGEISQGDYAIAIKEAENQIRKSKSSTEDLGRVIGSISKQGVDSFVEFAFKAEKAFDGFVKAALKQLAKLAASKLFSWALTALTGGSTGVVATIFGGLFADGGFLSPGKFGIVGEEGPEIVFGGNRGLTIEPLRAVSPESAQPARSAPWMGGGGSEESAGAIASEILARVGPPPSYASPEVAATDEYYRRLFSAMSRDGRWRGAL